MPARIFKGKTVGNQPCAHWKHIYAECKKHEQFIVEIRKYDEDTEISDQQRKYFHAVPVKHYAEHTGHSMLKAKILLKRHIAPDLFMKNVRPKESRRGSIMFECTDAYCKDLMYLPAQDEHGAYVCPLCHSDVRMFFMLSIMELKIKQVNEVIKNAVDFMGSINCPIEMPNPEWRVNDA